jgi:plastocyanin
LNDLLSPPVSLDMQNNTLPRTRRSLALAIGVVLALVLMLGACSSSSKPAAGSSSNSTTGVTIKDLTFTTTPVKAGSTVTVQNNDNVTHTVTSDDGKFDISIDAGKSGTFTAPAAGTYKFHCKIHSQMHGTLTVQ